MAANAWLRTLSLLPSVLTLLLISLTLILGLGRLEASHLATLLILLTIVAGLLALSHLKDQTWAWRLALLIASSTLLVLAILVWSVDVLSLYGLFILVLAAAVIGGLGEVVRPMGLRLGKAESREVGNVLTTVAARVGVLLTASLVLSILIWISLSFLTLGPTSEFTAFFLALVVIVILALLASLPE